jgi:ABC-type oligopeptide transport system substrate-binding subunit
MYPLHKSLRFAAAVVLSLAALAHPVAAQELKIAVAADVTSIDPHFFNLFPNNNMAEHIFDKLVQMDPDWKMIPVSPRRGKRSTTRPGSSSCAKG